MVRPMKTLLLNEFGRELLEYSFGRHYYFIIFRGKVNIGGYYKYNSLKYSYFYFLNQQNLRVGGLEDRNIKKFWPKLVYIEKPSGKKIRIALKFPNNSIQYFDKYITQVIPTQESIWVSKNVPFSIEIWVGVVDWRLPCTCSYSDCSFLWSDCYTVN